MSEVLRTSGGVIQSEDFDVICSVICSVFHCTKEEIFDIKPLQGGITNSVLEFRVPKGRFVYRYPGTGSSILVDRGREMCSQFLAAESGIDSTLVSMSRTEGWRIARYVESRRFDYRNLSDVFRGVQLLKRLHSVPVKFRWEFDILTKWESLRDAIPPESYGDNFLEYPLFSSIRNRVYLLYDLAQQDGISKCLSHGDCRDVNFLINDNEIHLIDWEYSGYGDPGFDIGTYVCGGEHTNEEVERILFIYYGRTPTPLERRHFYAYIAISGFFYMHWAMFKESQGQKIGELKHYWYKYATDYSTIALEMYKYGKDNK